MGHSSTSAQEDALAIILAAGEGTRMRSDRPKVLHALAGRSMLGHVLASVREEALQRVTVVIGPGHEAVADDANANHPGATVVVQRERKGTAHAVLQARESLVAQKGPVVVLFGDTPLVQPETISRLVDAIRAGHAVAVLGFQASNPTGYGRLLTDDHGQLRAIREHKDATEAERMIRLCNAGLMAFSGEHALPLLEAVGQANAQGEFYLTDGVEIARQCGLSCVIVEADETEVMGVNDRVQLARAESVLQTRLREKVMREGVTLLDPASVYLSHDTRFGRDVIVEPHVVFGLNVVVGDRVTIHAFSHLEGATLGEGVHIGPFARLRPGADLAAKARVGNFVEVKNASLGIGAKVNHLSYIGDARVGAGANIGAGTITCNYDGYFKYRTDIGDGAFVGSNSALVAPVSIGKGAYIGSGSVITKDVAEGALAVGRGVQTEKPGWATRFHTTMAERKASKITK